MHDPIADKLRRLKAGDHREYPLLFAPFQVGLETDQVIKGTCVVLVVVAIFTVVVTAINYGLQELLQVITNIKGIGE